MRKQHFSRYFLALITILIAPMLASAAATGSQSFFYAGGTVDIGSGCGGTLGVSSSSMTFECPGGSVTIPYSSITLMQYRPKLSQKVRHMKLHWKVKPDTFASRKNQFFTVLYRQGGATQALVLRVLPTEMRPYLAEIELVTGKRIEVADYRGFD